MKRRATSLPSTPSSRQYVKAPEITRTRLYLETMGDVLPATGEKIIIDDAMKNLLPILPLNSKSLEKR